MKLLVPLTGFSCLDRSTSLAEVKTLHSKPEECSLIWHIGSTVLCYQLI